MLAAATRRRQLVSADVVKSLRRPLLFRQSIMKGEKISAKEAATYEQKED